MGRIAIRLAEQAASGGPVEHVVLQPQLLVRSSTRPVR
jgi:DNA-binding LacI/PurR family transcriptional regulator